jgi:hypothetical protein
VDAAELVGLLAEPERLRAELFKQAGRDAAPTQVEGEPHGYADPRVEQLVPCAATWSTKTY